MKGRNMFINKRLNKFIVGILLNVSIFVLVGDKSYAKQKNLTFNNINIEHGISQSTIEVIFQDSKGYIWLGTNDGLNRYNGYDFKIYNYEEDQNSISHNGITDITEDEEGNIWVATVQGVSKINPDTDQINSYTEYNSRIKEDSTSEILTTQNDKVLVGTYEGLNIYNEKTDRFDTVLDEDDGILSNVIYAVEEDKYGNIWIGTELGVNKVSKDFEVLETYPISVTENSLGESEVYVLYCDDESDLVWAGTDSSGVFKIDTKIKNITGYRNNPMDKKSIPSNQIGAIMRDREGNLWIGTTDGLATYNEQNDNFDIYKNKIYDKNSLVYDDVRSLIEDREGVIWVGTYSGISIFDTKSSITHYNAGPDDDYLLNENMIHGVYEDNEGYIWVGTKSKGVNIIDRKNMTSTYIDTENNITMSSNSINDITGYEDFIFIATDNGLIKIDKKSKNIKNYNLEDGIINEKIKDILVDDKGYLWLGTTNGLSILNIETDEVIDMSKHITEGAYVRHIYQDSYGNYYLGLLKDGGLCVINTNENYIKYYKNIKGDKNSISSNRIRYINGDSEGNIWIGTSYGLNKLDPKTEKFNRYTTKDKIANNTIYGVLIDDDDNIWISTNKGISKINPKDNTINNLSVTDGLQGNEFNGNASFKSNSGELFFGGTNGLNSFYPGEINNVGSKSKILFDGFEVNNREYSNIQGLKLDKKTDTLKIKFFTPIYSSNKNYSYEYKLIGTSSATSTTKENYVIYNDLRPGNYIFEVSALDSRGYISDKASVSFSIEYPFWISPAAFIIYMILIALFIIIQKNKVKTLDQLVRKRTEKLEEEMERNVVLFNKNIKLEENKNKYLVNLSHELRTPLNVISSTNQLILGLIKKNTPIKEEKLIHYIDISQRNSNRLLNLVNNIVDGTKLQNDMYVINLKEVDIVYLVEETALTLTDYVKSKNIELIIDPEIEEKIIWCDHNDIERCVINLVGNAVKFTAEGGSITISIKDLDDKVMISVLDTGIGIDEKYHKVIFDRFNQVVDLDNEVKCGSGLGLTITNQIVKLHKGEISVESKPGEGSKFIIILPVNLNLENITDK
ncbi:histidine kinase [Romboutsia weinsteinii]|uniref:histidine kinase n=1 Tax=Romboutsia weinsteinii TaxID=2020949 RepID=A0A371J6A0_9FIRM|nr:two-component regulator propeller domain-containing protein [Romboutsia weinsteinii]RDY28197.1 histidine kinase [Romboutsia weinsteinii]